MPATKTNPLSGLASRLNGTIHLDAINQSASNRFIQKEEELLRINPYATTDACSSRIAARGMPTSDFGTETHDHAEHAVTENFILYRILGAHLMAAFVLSMKATKAATLKWCVGTANIVLSIRDMGRYRKNEFLGCFPATITAEELFLHDVGHFLSPHHYTWLFDNYPSVKRILVTAVAPVEVLLGLQSFWPDSYQITWVDEDTYHYELEGNTGDYYEQSKATTRMLLAGSMNGHSVEKIYSSRAHHLFAISREQAPIADKVRTFEGPDATLLPQSSGDSIPMADRLVDRKLAISTLHYARHLKKGFTVHDAIARARNSRKPEHAWMTEGSWLVLERYCAEARDRMLGVEYKFRPDTRIQALGVSIRRTAKQLKWPITLLLLGTTVLAWCLLLAYLSIPLRASPRLFLNKYGRLSYGQPRVIEVITTRSFRFGTNLINPDPRPNLLKAAALAATEVWRALQVDPDNDFLMAAQLFSRLSHVATSRVWRFAGVTLLRSVFSEAVVSTILAKDWAYLLSMAVRVEDTTTIRINGGRSEIDARWLSGPVLLTLLTLAVAFFWPHEAWTNPTRRALDTVKLPAWRASFTLTQMQSEGHVFWSRAPTPPAGEPTGAPPPPTNYRPPAVEDAPEEPREIIGRCTLPQSNRHDWLDELINPLPTPPITVTITTPQGDCYTVLEGAKKESESDPKPVVATPSLPTPEPTTASPIEEPQPQSDTSPAPSPSSQITDYQIDIARRSPGDKNRCPQIRDGISCLVKALAQKTGRSWMEIWNIIDDFFDPAALEAAIKRDNGLDTDAVAAVALTMGVHFIIFSTESGAYVVGNLDTPFGGELHHSPGHWHNVHDDGEEIEVVAAEEITTAAETVIQSGGTSIKPTGIKFNLKQFEKDFLSFIAVIKGKEARIETTKFFTHHLDHARGKVLASDYKNRFTGSVLHKGKYAAKRYVERLDAMFDTVVPRSVRTTTILGYNGSGKTAPIVAFFNAFPEYKHFLKVRVYSRNLRAELCRDLKMTGSMSFRVGTKESYDKTAEILWRDEISLLPNGDGEYALMADCATQVMINSGDVTQLHDFENGEEAQWPRLEKEAFYYAKYATHYCAWAHRAPDRITSVFGIRSSNKTEPAVSLSPIATSQVSFAMATKTVEYERLNGRESHTIASSQGLTERRPISLIADYPLNRFGSAALISMVANRTTTHLEIVEAPDVVSGNASKRHPLIQALISGKEGNFEKIFAKELGTLKVHRTPLPIPKKKNKGGALPPPEPLTRTQKRNALKRAAMKGRTDEAAARRKAAKEVKQRVKRAVREEINASVTADALATDWVPPNLRSYLRQENLDTPIELSGGTQQEREYFQKTYMTATSLEELCVNEAADVSTLELDRMVKGVKSNLFPEERNHESTNGVYLSAMAPIHRSKDDPTLLDAAKKKRLPRATIEENVAEWCDPGKRAAGEALHQAYCKLFELPEGKCTWRQDLWEQAYRESDVSKLTKKTRAFIEANDFKSDGEWRINHAEIFTKDQQKVKPPTDPDSAALHPEFKECQTIAQLPDHWLLLFGPVIRYLTLWMNEHIAEHCPNILIIGGKTPRQMNRWAKRYIKRHWKKFLTNDFKQFDRSQRAEALWREFLVMKKFQIPDWMIDLYVYQKLTLDHQLWSSMIMRFTGEPGTYRFNTDFSAAQLSLQYDPPRGTAMVISGDDILIQGWFPSTKKWVSLKHLFSIESKTEHPEIPICCSYIFTADGVIKEPVHFGWKYAIAKEQGRMADVILSYAIDHALGAEMGDQVVEHLTPTQVLWHKALRNQLFQDGGPAIRSILTTAEVPGLPEDEHEKIAALPTRQRLEAYRLHLSTISRQGGLKDSGAGITAIPHAKHTQTSHLTDLNLKIAMSTSAPVSHALCVNNAFCRINPTVWHRNLRRPTVPPPPSPPQQPQPRPPPGSTARRPPATLTAANAPTTVVRAIISAPASMAEPTLLPIDRTLPQIARVFERFAQVTVRTIGASVPDGFTSTEQGALTMEFIPSSILTRTRAEMREGRGATSTASALRALRENFDREEGNMSRNLDASQRTNGAPGIVLAYQNTSATAKDIEVEITVVRRGPQTPVQTSFRCPRVTDAVTPGGPAPIARIPGTANMFFIRIPDGYRLRVNSGNPGWSDGTNHARLRFNNADVTAMQFPELLRLCQAMPASNLLAPWTYRWREEI